MLRVKYIHVCERNFLLKGFLNKCNIYDILCVRVCIGGILCVRVWIGDILCVRVWLGGILCVKVSIGDILCVRVWLGGILGVRVVMGDIPGERAFMGHLYIIYGTIICCVMAVRCAILGIKAVWMIYLVSRM